MKAAADTSEQVAVLTGREYKQQYALIWRIIGGELSRGFTRPVEPSRQNSRDLGLIGGFLWLT